MPELYGNFLLCDWKLLARSPYHVGLSSGDQRKQSRHRALQTTRRASIGSIAGHDVRAALHGSSLYSHTTTHTTQLLVHVDFNTVSVSYVHFNDLSSAQSNICTYCYHRLFVERTISRRV